MAVLYCDRPDVAAWGYPAGLHRCHARNTVYNPCSIEYPLKTDPG